MLSHKEERKDEVFVGNTSAIISEERERLFKLNKINYRLGNIAYDIDGKKMKSYKIT